MTSKSTPPNKEMPPDVLTYLRQLEKEDRKATEARLEEIEEERKAARNTRKLWMADRRIGSLPIDNLISNPEASDEKVSEFFAAQLPPIEANSLAELNPQTILDDYRDLMNVKDVFDQLISTVFENRERYNLSSKVHFATLERPTLNALIRQVPNSDNYIAVFNRGYWHSFEAVAAMISASLDYKDQDPLFLQFNRDKADQNILLFSDVEQRILIGQSADYSQYLPRRSDRGFLVMQEALSASMKHFVLGHEYAHFLRGHLRTNEHGHNFVEASAAAVSVSEPETEQDENWNTYLWVDEYDADRTGLDLTVYLMAAMLSGNPIAYALGSEAAIASLYFLYRAESRSNKVFKPWSSHPPTWMRLQMMVSTTQSLLYSMNPKLQAIAQQRMNEIVTSIDYLFDNTASVSIPYRSNTEHSERNLQDIVFHAQFEIHPGTARPVPEKFMEGLYLLRDKLKKMAPTGKFDEKAIKADDNYFAAHMYQVFHNRLYDDTTVTPAESHQIVQDCIGVLDKNSKALQELHARFS